MRYRNDNSMTMLAGDTGWRGVNLRLDPSLLPEGFASKAVNMRFRNGIAETREGSMVIGWLNNITGGNITPWGTVYGVGVFRDPTTFMEYVLIAADGNVYACLPNNAPRQLTLPAGETVTARCTFVQCFNVVVMLRGFDNDPLVMDDMAVGFKAITQTLSGTGTLTIPRALRGVNAGARLWLAREDDTLVASDVLDYTRYSVMNDLRINQGTDDRIVTLVVFGGDIVVLKDKTVHRLFDIQGSLADVSAVEVTRRYGCVAADSAVDCGSDLLWLSQEGVASLTLTIQNEVQAAQGALAGKNRMFSEDIGPLIQQVNGKYVSTAFGALWQDRYYLGLPKDMAEKLGDEEIFDTLSTTTISIPTVSGASYRFVKSENVTNLVNGASTYTTSIDFVAAGTSVTINFVGSIGSVSSLKRLYSGVNNILAHYDFQNAAWGGYDESEKIAFKFIFTATYTNRQRLFVVTQDGYVRLWEEDYADRLSVPYADVQVVNAPDMAGANPVTTGDTLRVNGGTTLTADTTTTVNTATVWGAYKAILAGNPAFQLWNVAGNAYGYRRDLASAWSAPNTTVRARKSDTNGLTIFNALGVRFYATNGVAPSVVTTGTGLTVSIVVEQQIQTTFETRAYTAPMGDDSRPLYCTLDVQTWNPSYSADVLFEGVNEETAIIGTTTRSRTIYDRPFNKAAWTSSNINDDFDTPYRQDYSIQPTSSTYEFYGGDGVRGDLHQAARHTTRVGNRSRASRARLECTQGRVRLLAVRFEQLARQPRYGIRV